MLDSALCQQVSPTRLWTLTSWTLQFLLVHPFLVAIALLTIASAPWLLRRERWKKPVTIFGVLSMALYLGVASPVFSGVGNQLLTSFIAPDSGEPAQAIVVLGRGQRQNNSRTQTALALWQENRAPLIFPSGRKDAPIMAELLRAQNVPESAIAGEPCSLTTDQNAEFTAATLRPKGVKKIILVTDPPHLLRSQLTFESFGFEVIAHPTALDPSTDRIQKRFLVLRESVGLVSYGLMGRYFSREVPPASIIYASKEVS